MKTKTNKLIAEFMGIKPRFEGPNVYSYSDAPFFNVREDNPEKVMKAICNYVKYHSSWDWLMPVVHKCLEICNEEMLNEWEASFSDKFFTCAIEPMYNEVIEFIKWHNAR